MCGEVQVHGFMGSWLGSSSSGRMEDGGLRRYIAVRREDAMGGGMNDLAGLRDKDIHSFAKDPLNPEDAYSSLILAVL